MRAVLVLIAAYLLGSIPFGYLIVRGKEGGDIRRSGSGGTGATNVSRRAGKLAGVCTLLLDAAKGALAAWLARMASGAGPDVDWLVACAAFAVVAGHCFPVWLTFRGGKGVATGVGVFLVLSPVAVACAGVLFILVVWSTRYVSLGSVMAAGVLPLCVWLMSVYLEPVAYPSPVIVTSIACGALIIFMHRANMGRLRRGTESRFK